MNTLQENRREERLFNPYFVLVWLITLCVYMGHVMMNSTVNMYTASLGFPKAVNGYMAVGYAILAITGRIIGGNICDRRSRRIVQICGALLFGTGIVLLGFSVTIPTLILCRSLHGGGYGMVYTADSNANVDVTPDKKRQEGIGFYFIASAVAFAFGSTIVVQLSGNGQNLRPVFILCASLLGMGALLACFNRYEKKPYYQEKKARTVIKNDAKGISRYLEKKALVPGLVQLFASMGATGASYYALLYAKEMGFAGSSLFFTAAAITMAVCNLSQAKLVRRFGSTAVLSVGFGFFALTLALQAVTANNVIYVIQGAAFGVQQGFAWPVATALAMEGIPYNRRGAASSTTFIMTDLGAAFSGVVLGNAIDLVGYPLMYGILAATQAAGLVTSLVVVRRRSKQNATSEEAA